MKKYKSVEEFLSNQETEKLLQVLAIRAIIFKAEPAITESIKWNSPNYNFKGEDRITFNVMNKENRVKLIIHMGALKKENKKGQPVIDDPDGLVEWSSDIRGIIMFCSLEEIRERSGKLEELIGRWLLVE